MSPAGSVQRNTPGYLVSVGVRKAIGVIVDRKSRCNRCIDRCSLRVGGSAVQAAATYS